VLRLSKHAVDPDMALAHNVVMNTHIEGGESK